MKVINKIVCFLSVLVLCVPLVCFNVGAESSSSAGNPIKDFYSSFDPSVYKERTSSYNDSDYASKDYVEHSFNGTDYYIPIDDFIDSFLPCIGTYSPSYYCSDVLSADTLYYIIFTSGNTPQTFHHLFFCSTSPITLVKDSDYIYFNSDSTIFSIETNFGYTPGQSIRYYYPVFYDHGAAKVDSYSFSDSDYCNLKFSSDTTSLKNTLYCGCPTTLSKFSEVEWDNIYTNCSGLADVSVLPNLTDKNIPQIGYVPTLKDNIDVKLTPEFGLDMDRVFDKNTGQNDYFKLEVTNNSDSNIQFYCAIVDSGVKTLYNDNGQVSDFAFNHSYWDYIHDSEYYQLDSVTESRYLGFATTTTLYVNKLAGNIFWIMLKPGEHFEDYIYWENVKIMPTTSYDFLCEACPTQNDIAADVFVTSNEQLEKQFYMTGGSKAHWWSISESLEVDQSVEQYALKSEDVCEVFRVNFSVLTIPEFSSTVRGGNSKITSGWSDTQAQASNPYYKQNLMTGQIEAVENYKEYTGNLADVDVDIDNVGVDDVKGYISYSQNFFSLLKSVFLSFPSLWVLIVFGLTAIIVIAIIRYIRG